MNLQELIAAHKGDRSYRELAKACGNNPTAGRLQQMSAGDLKEWPKPETIQSLSRGLRVSEVAVVLAVAESLGLDVTRASASLDDYLPAGTQRLTEDQMRAIGMLVHSIVKERHEGRRRDDWQSEAEKSGQVTPIRRAGDDALPPDWEASLAADRQEAEPVGERMRREQDEDAERGEER